MSALDALQRRIPRWLGIDRAVFFAILGKIWSSFAGLVTILLVAVFFSRELQGYYYTFNTVLALQVFAELGLGAVLTYYASHEWAKLALDRHGQVIGDADALSRLTSLGRFGVKWYLIAGAAISTVLVIGGLVFFSTAEPRAFPWRAPWVALCVVTGLSLWVVPIVALLEGCNQVSRVYAYRLIQFVASGVAVWVAICLDAGLWAAPIGGLAGLVALLVPIGRRYGRFVMAILFGQPKGPLLNWRKDILPMQWRIALSWIGGYFTFSLFSPVLFHYQGPIVAGQMGMTWVFVSALMAVASSWVTPKAPLFGMLIAQQKYAELDQLFWRITAAVVAVTAVGALSIWVLVFVLGQLHHPFATRVLDSTTTGYLLVATIIVSASLPMAIYLRAHKKEPLLTLSVISGLLTGIAVVVLGRHYSADGVAIGYLVVMATLTPFVALIWHRRRAEWHAHAAS
ncbi:MAG: hypothetical protein OEU36_02455 [Gammaproteobacteria bacterium]|nr:hypothetical protein [Gammaproteobacteria bacterium]